MVSPPALRPSTASDAPVGEALDKLKPALAEVGAEIDRLLDSLLAVPEDSRDRLYHAMRHAAIGGGKRLRPLLVVAACELYHVDRRRALRVGPAAAFVHVYSLIPDVLPCMYDAALSRGRPPPPPPPAARPPP